MTSVMLRVKRRRREFDDKNTHTTSQQFGVTHLLFTSSSILTTYSVCDLCSTEGFESMRSDSEPTPPVFHLSAINC